MKSLTMELYLNYNNELSEQEKRILQLFHHLEFCSNMLHVVSFFNCNIAPVRYFNDSGHTDNLHLNKATSKPATV